MNNSKKILDNFFLSINKNIDKIFDSAKYDFEKKKAFEKKGVHDRIPY